MEQSETPKNISAQIIDIYDNNRIADVFGDIGGRFVRVQRTQDNAFIVRRNGVGAGTVNGRSLGSGDDIKPAAFAEEFADGADKGGEQDTERTAFPQGHFHRFRNTKTNAVGRFGDKAAQQHSQAAGMDIFHVDSTLCVQATLFGNEQHVAFHHGRSGICGADLVDLVLIGHYVSADRMAAVRNAVDLDDLVFPSLLVSSFISYTCAFFW